MRVLVVEKRQHPVREAAFKVGESSVEIGAHYFQKRLGLEPHLRQRPAREARASLLLPAWRQPRPRVARRARPAAVSAGAVLPARSRTPREHLLRDRRASRRGGARRLPRPDDRASAPRRPSRARLPTPRRRPRRSTTRWVVDASGRAGLLKRQLGLARPSTHGANAVWFRVRSRVQVDDWSDDPAWQARVPSGQRWLSTNHLMGAGLLGLADPARLRQHQLRHRRRRRHASVQPDQPLRARDGLAARVRAAVRGGHGAAYATSSRTSSRCSTSRTAARASSRRPLGARRRGRRLHRSVLFAGLRLHRDGQRLRDRSHRARASRARTSRRAPRSFNTTYLRLFDAFIRLYDGQYRIMGNAQVMTAKVAWDNACYWAITALLFFQRRFRRPEFMDSIDPLMRRFFVLHARMQQLLRAWDRGRRRARPTPATPPTWSTSSGSARCRPASTIR